MHPISFALIGTLVTVASVTGFLGATHSHLRTAHSLLAANAEIVREDKTEPSSTQILASAVTENSARQSVSAKLSETLNTGLSSIRATGRYVSAGLRLRLEFTLKLEDGTTGSLVEVSDGETLWSQMAALGTTRLTRRDIRQILQAGAAKTGGEKQWAMELGLGGIPGLLASMQKSMRFESVHTEDHSGRTLTVIEGRWKDEVRSRFVRDKSSPLPPHMPDLVRVYFDSVTLFPHRIAYLRTPADGTPLKSLLTLDFRDVVLDGVVDQADFEFIPPEGVVPEDITRQYLDLLRPSAGEQPAK